MKAVVWSKPNCPQCLKAKALLTSKGIDYEEKLIGTNATREELLELVPQARSVPQIFLDGKPVGDYNNLLQFLGAQ